MSCLVKAVVVGLRRVRGWKLVCASMFLAASCVAAAPAQAPAVGCTLEKETYTCNWAAFQAALAAAHTVAVESQPMDRFAAAQLRGLAGNLDKSVAAPGQPADLTFLLVPMEGTGISIGPAGQPVATLRIYGPGQAGSRTLLWAETLISHPDRPWPALVHELIEQFRDRVARH